VFERIDGFPAGVIALRGTGHITGEDYAAVLEPAVAAATAGGRKARLLLEFGEGFDGYSPDAILADSSAGIRHFASFERIAVVTDVPWLRHAVQLFGPLIPGHVHAYAVDQTDEARSWIAETA
jgi:hypothetical protein